MPVSNKQINAHRVTGKRVPGMGDSEKGTSVVIAVTYRQEWQDGFGVRGWKLDSALDEPDVIAATAETGCQINTSVLVHDMLDHYISGFPLSGHRQEAMALIQLASRVGSDPRPDYEQMVDEDLIQGRVSGESFRSFLPEDLVRLLPKEPFSGKETIEFLINKKGKKLLRSILVGQFLELGQRGRPLAMLNWHRHNLDYHRRKEIGLCLQKLLVRIDRVVVENSYRHADGEFRVGNRHCEVHVRNPAKHFYSLAV